MTPDFKFLNYVPRDFFRVGYISLYTLVLNSLV